MAGTPREHPIVIGVESFGEIPVGDDGHLLSEWQPGALRPPVRALQSYRLRQQRGTVGLRLTLSRSRWSQPIMSPRDDQRRLRPVRAGLAGDHGYR
jgi:hypothetical protein